MEVLGIVSAVAAIVSALNSSISLFGAWKRRRQRKELTEETAESALVKNPPTVQAKYDFGYNVLGARFSQGDGHSLREMTATLKKFTRTLHEFAGQLNGSVQPQIFILRTASETARHEAVGTLSQLFQRLSISRSIPRPLRRPRSSMLSTQQRNELWINAHDKLTVQHPSPESVYGAEIEPNPPQMSIHPEFRTSNDPIASPPFPYASLGDHLQEELTTRDPGPPIFNSANALREKLDRLPRSVHVDTSLRFVSAQSSVGQLRSSFQECSKAVHDRTAEPSREPSPGTRQTRSVLDSNIAILSTTPAIGLSLSPAPTLIGRSRVASVPGSMRNPSLMGTSVRANGSSTASYTSRVLEENIEMLGGRGDLGSAASTIAGRSRYSNSDIHEWLRTSHNNNES